MKKTVTMFSWIVMFSFFAAIAQAGSNTFLGDYAGTSSTGTDNTFIGYYAGYGSDGGSNTFIGTYAGRWNTTASWNTFVGHSAGRSNLSGNWNTFLGRDAGRSNTSGNNNTFVGESAGYSNTGSYNTFVGDNAGGSNTTANHNTFVGHMAGYDNTGAGNTFIGHEAGYVNTGNWNSFVGYLAGRSNTTGASNLFLGMYAGSSNTIEYTNTLIGNYADIEDSLPGEVINATAIGNRAFVSQANSLVLGSINGVNSANYSVNVGIGTSAPVRQLHVVGDQAVFRMDRPYDTAAFMLVRTDAGGTPLKTFVVGANASGSNSGSFVINDLGTAVSGAGTRRLTIDNNGIATFTSSVYALSFVPTSSLVYKTNVKTYENALETVKKLRGVSFNWKESGKPSVGLIAEEVEQVIPAVVAYDGKDTVGVNYDSLVGVLVEAIKEQQAELDALKDLKRINEEQQKIISTHSEEIAELKRLLIISQSVSKAD